MEQEDIKKRWREYTEELYKKDTQSIDVNDGSTIELEPDILESEIKWAFECIANNKAPGTDEIPAELFKILGDEAVKILLAICQQIWKTQQWPKDWKRSIYIPIPKKGSAKECSNYSRFCKPDWNNIWHENFQMYRPGLEGAEAPEIISPTFGG
ncbi:unnamed protein product [Rotaria magnacalcarata]|uniref:Reverse transcriptase n=1 Tax=Rotaria magnacalcarata TaxID=392030 RepID=A0A816MNE7_9BILA|nr:unnamed protein product [Rotaria magnacalcarata]